MVLKEARDKREDVKRFIGQGVEPSEKRRQDKSANMALENEQKLTFEYVARQWHEKAMPQWSEGHQKKILSRLENQLFPYIGNIPISQLATTDYLAAIQKAEARGAIETAHRLAQLCGQVAKDSVHAGIMKHDTAAMLKGALS